MTQLINTLSLLTGNESLLMLIFNSNGLYVTQFLHNCSYLRSKDNSPVNPEHSTVYQVSISKYRVNYLSWEFILLLCKIVQSCSCFLTLRLQFCCLCASGNGSSIDWLFHQLIPQHIFNWKAVERQIQSWGICASPASGLSLCWTWLLGWTR